MNRNIRHVDPERTVDRGQCSAEPSRLRTACPICGKQFLASVVIQDEPVRDEARGCECVERHLYCDHCNIVVSRTFLIESSTGTSWELSAARVERKPAAVAVFLRNNPQAAGVEG